MGVSQVYENLASNSKAYGNWTTTNITTAAALDPWGQFNAVRMANSSLTADFHRGYMTDNTTPTEDPFFITLYLKGTASKFLVLFTSGSAANVSLTNGTLNDSNDASLVSSELIGNGWRKVVLQCTDFGTGVFQLAVDAPALSSTFTPPTTSTYCDVVVQISNDSDNLVYPTEGGPQAEIALPAGQLWIATAQALEEYAALVSPSSGSVTVSSSDYGQDGDTLRLKRGSKTTLSFTPTTPVTMSHVLFGIRDNSRSLLKLTGTISTSTLLTFTISAEDAMDLYEGNHNYDVFEVESYDAGTGAYTDARLVVTAPVIVDPLYLRLENQ